MAGVRQLYGLVELDAPGAGAHHGDAAAHENRLVDVMGDKQHGFFLGFPDAQQQLLHQLAGLVVQGAKRLVHQQHARAVGQGSGNGHALLHATRELLRKMVLEAAQAHLVDECSCGFELYSAWQAALSQAKTNIFLHGQPGKQGVALEHHATVGAWALDGSAVKQHLAAGLGVQAGNNAQQSALAAAAGP